MKLVQTIKELQSELDALRSEGKTIGLVPTMGALHAGHASLVKRAVAENDVVVVSDFVNPTQFNDKNDLAKYPRTLDADCELLEKVGAAFVFAPSVEEIYPEPDTRQFSYAPLDTVMEGRFRPGHFNGVCQIVSKLFMIVNPTRAYFGEKDFQQLAIIREMVKQIGFNGLEIVGCPIVREEDGLALSSRNARLSAVEREYALNISQTLFKSCTFAKSHPVAETQKFVEDAIAAAPGLRILDIGTGSGCIAVTLSKELPEAEVTAWDISGEALAIAGDNNRLLQTSVQFVQRDVLTYQPAEDEYFDVIVSNPPYVTETEKKDMEPNVLNWEPSGALFVPDSDPLRFYRRIGELGRSMLTAGGQLYFEINRAFGEAVASMLRKQG